MLCQDWSLPACAPPAPSLKRLYRQVLHLSPCFPHLPFLICTGSHSTRLSQSKNFAAISLIFRAPRHSLPKHSHLMISLLLPIWFAQVLTPTTSMTSNQMLTLPPISACSPESAAVWTLLTLALFIELFPAPMANQLCFAFMLFMSLTFFHLNRLWPHHIRLMTRTIIWGHPLGLSSFMAFVWSISHTMRLHPFQSWRPHLACNILLFFAHRSTLLTLVLSAPHHSMCKLFVRTPLAHPGFILILPSTPFHLKTGIMQNPWSSRIQQAFWHHHRISSMLTTILVMLVFVTSNNGHRMANTAWSLLSPALSCLSIWASLQEASSICNWRPCQACCLSWCLCFYWSYGLWHRWSYTISCWSNIVASVQVLLSLANH